ncbi:bifunctional adenosylcobinamide kinase/adenosylcobinamide-phosphate guanylyltransferase [Desulfoluna spongiiphila]|uniref:Adenosylcobinamide kinase n=1 Tax=Desulfoluna spongiiphila TaxID=419481 RepID=A0A1G5JE28_9BACT|nr:bifunctional adenosylcobinamide kinase/adenosylcobinamide-phosphate guanylyltransferase [Desulfoluna spongiiphila]SCY85958.1 adenosylcobinamide kinase /adenosylcobinamide-phosphate guanylyltransferase [Desulfoluna spongiiphila]VVS90820.1 cobinamide kinase/cobinamide phosphate guanyltransferase [Desulfoluna spongiiphila]
MGSFTFVTGGCRSGKSSHAQKLAESLAADNRLYVATLQPMDTEMERRVTDHQSQRDDSWYTIEEPYDIVRVLEEEQDKAGVILVDCITLWVTNLFMAEQSEEEILAFVDDFAEAAAASKVPVVTVSNEVGMGIVPDNTLSRQFRDIQGAANQRLAARAHKVVFTVSGIPMTVKG